MFRGGESSLLQKPYRYVVAQRVGVFAQFWSENGYIFAHFCLESDMIFEEITTECMNLIVVSIPNE